VKYIQKVQRPWSKGFVGVIAGMKNLAALGIENSHNQAFLEYSNSLYNFREVKRHMDYIRGEYNKAGKVNIKKFINGLLYYRNKME